jgi:hypothetical protein
MSSHSRLTQSHSTIRWSPSFGVDIYIDESSIFICLNLNKKLGILKTTHRKHLQGLIDKSRIFVEKGRILMGCIDETGLLDENECFIKCDNVLMMMRDEELNGEGNDEDKDNESLVYTILKGKIAVAKNPCMHPGDIRVLNAVDKPHLRHLVNCIVFPSKGNDKFYFDKSILKNIFIHLSQKANAPSPQW